MTLAPPNESEIMLLLRRWTAGFDLSQVTHEVREVDADLRRIRVAARPRR